MKVGFLSALYSDEVFGGGIKTYLYYLSQELCRHGHKVTIITSGKPKEYYENGVHIIKIGEIEIFNSKNQLLSFRFLYKRLRYMVRAARIIKKYHFDIVEVPEGGCEHLFLVFNKPCPIITRFQGNVNYTKFPKSPIKFINILESMAARKSDGLSSVTARYGSMLAKDYKISLSVIRIIPYGIDLDFLLNHNKVNIRSKYNLEGKKIILFTGELSFRKGIDLLYQTSGRFLENPELIFVMIGKDTSFSNSLKFTANILHLKDLSKNELFSFYSECDIFIMPSLFESLSYSILEALIFGKPILAANVGGIPEIVLNNYNGILFKAGDIEDLVIKLKYLLENFNLLSKMGKHSREMSKKYQIYEIARSTVKFYEEIILKKAKRRNEDLFSAL